MYKGIIFDIDGVVINTEGVHFEAFKEVLKSYDYSLDNRSYKKHFGGKTIRGGVLSLLNEVDLAISEPEDQFINSFIQKKIKTTIQHFKEDLEYYDDTISFIHTIKNGGMDLKNIGTLDNSPTIALATGLEKIMIDEVVKHHDLDNIFAVKVTADDYKRSKPHPEVYELAAKSMGLKPHELIGIEDSPSGVSSLNATGIFSVGITNSYSKEELSHANIVVPSLMELVK